MAKEKVEITEFISQFLDSPLIKGGTEDKPYFSTRCPFHDDQGSPNFYIYPKVQRCVCYRCWNKDGYYDVYDFYMKLMGCTFAEAREKASFEVSAAWKTRRKILGKLLQRRQQHFGDPYSVEFAKRLRAKTKDNRLEALRIVQEVSIASFNDSKTFKEMLRKL